MRRVTKKVSVNFSIVEELKEATLKSFDEGHYLQASIILFQMIEILLKTAIKGYGRNHGVTENTLRKAADNETSFGRLVMHFDLVYPDNGLGKRLLEFNNARNRIIHRLFTDFESMSALESQLKEFCVEGVELNQALIKVMGV